MRTKADVLADIGTVSYQITELTDRKRLLESELILVSRRDIRDARGSGVVVFGQRRDIHRP